jgi:Tfp pilus assembly protein FimT
MKSFGNNDGFSTVELSIVLVLTGLLLIAVTGIAALIKESKLKQRALEIEILDIAMRYSHTYKSYL